MAPYINEQLDKGDGLEAKTVANNTKLGAEAKPPVADDYMYDFKYNHELPTFDVLGIEIPADCNAQKEAETIVSRLTEVTNNGDASGFANLFLEHGECFGLVALQHG